MKRLLCALAAVLAVLYWAGDGKAAPPIIFVQNTSSTLTDQAVADALPAFQQALDRDFAPVWGVDATLEQVPADQQLTPGLWKITIADDPVDCYCEGFHDQGAAPFANVFVSVSPNWQITFSHELFEMLADPFVNAAPRAVHTRRGWLLVEVADPVEANTLAYWLNGAGGVPVAISDFVTPAWYTGGAGPYDFQHKARRALQVLTDGYYWLWRGGDWQAITP